MLRKKEHNTFINQNSNALKSVEPVYSGDDYFLRLQRIINEAKNEIHLQTYIFENDAAGKAIAACLKEAALRQVKVYVLLDGYGSKALPEKFTNDLVQHGIHFRFFSPFFSTNSFFIGRRLHHKVVVADGSIALIGGINIADKYHGTKTEEPWLDYAVQADGEIAGPLQELCRNIYFKKKQQARIKTISFFYSGGGASIRILQNDWVKRKNEISSAYNSAVQNAKKEVINFGSYFLPGRRLTTTLKNAAGKGVKIKLVLSGISDMPLIRRATCYLYSLLIRHNMELYEWNKSVLHGKVAVADDEWVTIGSHNLNHLSSYGSIEMNVEIHSPQFSAIFKPHLNKVIAQCEKITIETIEIRNGIISKFINWLSYRLVRTGLIIITYLPYKRFFKRYHAE